MTRGAALAAALFLWTLPVAGGQQDTDVDAPALRVQWTEFKKLYDSHAIVVVDVRGEEAFAQGHIPGARSIPLARIARDVSSLKKLQKPIVTYCA